MEFLYLITAIFIPSTVFFFLQWQKSQKNLSQRELEATELKIRLEEKESSLLNNINEQKTLEDKLEAERNLRIKSETKVSLALQEVQNSKERMNNWEETKAQHLESAKAAMMEAGSKMSSKLLEDHKREAEFHKKDSQERIKKTTEELSDKFKVIFDSVSNLHEQVKESKSTVDIVKNALLTPQGAGSLAEITLENIFKSSGLIENQDYIMQYHINAGDGKTLRPDAVIFLPDNHIIVVDSKASKFFMELEQSAANSPERKSVEESLKTTMNNHLKDLVKRDYKKAIEDSLIKSGKVNEINRIDVLMFLPSEIALDKLRKIDASFENKAHKERIIPVGTSGLINILLHTKLFISNIKQEHNSKIIITEVKAMLANVAKLHELSSAMGKGIKSSFDKYDKFAASFNRNFLSKVKKLDKLGIDIPKNKELQQLERYQITSHGSLIEGELEETNSGELEFESIKKLEEV